MNTKIAKKEVPLVSVVILTYNHENFIAQSLEGVLGQKVNFEYEIILSNDCSTDGTDAVCRQYAKENPCIHYFNHPQNIGMIANHCWSVKQANGKYLAYCDGDDYWIDEYKLQRQVDYMESHPECSICYHNVIVDNGVSRWPFISLNKAKGLIEIEEIVTRWAIPTSAVVFRREYIEGEEENVIRYSNEDYAVEIFMKSKGDCFYDSSLGAIYRKHAASVSAGMNANAIIMQENIIGLLRDAEMWFPINKRQCFDDAIVEYDVSINKMKRRIKYPFIKYFKKNTYKRWILSLLK